MTLYIRMALYALSAGAAGMGLGELSPDGAHFTISLDTAAQIIGGSVTFIGTFVASRFAKVR